MRNLFHNKKVRRRAFVVSAGVFGLCLLFLLVISQGEPTLKTSKARFLLFLMGLSSAFTYELAGQTLSERQKRKRSDKRILAFDNLHLDLKRAVFLCSGEIPAHRTVRRPTHLKKFNKLFLSVSIIIASGLGLYLFSNNRITIDEAMVIIDAESSVPIEEELLGSLDELIVPIEEEFVVSVKAPKSPPTSQPLWPDSQIISEDPANITFHPLTPAHDCPSADVEDTVAPAVAIYSITFVVNGIEQIVYDMGTLQASIGDQVRVKEIKSCVVVSAEDSGSYFHIEFYPVDQNGGIGSELTKTNAIYLFPNLETISGPDYTWIIDDTWEYISIDLFHYSAGLEIQNPKCNSGICEVDDRMVVRIGERDN